MPKSSPSDRKCCNCSSSCDQTSDGRPVSPVNVTPADDPNGRPELWCARCFVFKRMHLEPERFNASSTAAVRCQFCGGESVCFSLGPGGAARCGCCGRPGAILIRPSEEDMAAMFAAVRDVAEDKRILKDVRK